MTFEAAEIIGIGTAAFGALGSGLMMILNSAKEQRQSQAAMAERMIESQSAMAERMTEALQGMQRDAHRVIERNTVAIQQGIAATKDLTEAVERLTGRVELVEREVATRTPTQRFDRAG